MNKATLLVVACAVAAVALLLPQRADTRKMTKWEYKCALPPGTHKLDSADRSEHEKAFHNAASDKQAHPSGVVLNHLGSSGWELVAIDPNNGHYCFKRPTG